MSNMKDLMQEVREVVVTTEKDFRGLGKAFWFGLLKKFGPSSFSEGKSFPNVMVKGTYKGTPWSFMATLGDSGAIQLELDNQKSTGPGAMVHMRPERVGRDLKGSIRRGFAKMLKSVQMGTPLLKGMREDRNMGLNDLMDGLREPMDEARLPQSVASKTLRNSGAPGRDGKFDREAQSFWFKVAKMARTGVDKPDFLMSEGKPQVLLPIKLPKDSKTGLAMKGAFLVKFSHGDYIAVECHVWFPELPGSWLNAVGKPWKDYRATDDKTFRPGEDISGGKLVKVMHKMMADNRSKAKKAAGDGNWAQYKGQKESVDSDDTQGLMESLRQRAGLIEE